MQALEDPPLDEGLGRTRRAVQLGKPASVRAKHGKIEHSGRKLQHQVTRTRV